MLFIMGCQSVFKTLVHACHVFPCLFSMLSHTKFPCQSPPPGSVMTDDDKHLPRHEPGAAHQLLRSYCDTIIRQRCCSNSKGFS